MSDQPVSVPPPELSEQEKAGLILGVERMKGGYAALGDLAGALKKRLDNLEARSRLKIGKEDGLLFRRAEIGSVLDLVLQRCKITHDAARGLILRHPDVFAPSPGQDGQPVVESAETPTESSALSEVSASVPV